MSMLRTGQVLWSIGNTMLVSRGWKRSMQLQLLGPVYTWRALKDVKLNNN